MSQFSSYIIGETTLAIRCAEMLLERGHALYGAIADAPEVVRWAHGRGIDVIDPADDLVAALGARPADYLFSIVNSRILRPDVLRAVGRCAINYHDGPLPRYAGMHATSWGILHREREWAITWHVVAEDVDAGAILEQPPVEIAPDDTALTLNVKCYEAAAAAFSTLIDALATGNCAGRPQDLTKRTYFPRAKRPEVAGVIAWERSAEEISALARALDFGPYANPLGRPKLVTADSVFICPEIEILEARATAPPGTIVRVDDQQLVIASADREVTIPRLLSLDGARVDLARAAERLGLGAGARLPSISGPVADRITAVDTGAAKHEPRLVERLASIRPATLPYQRSAVEKGSERQRACVDVPIPPAFFEGAREDWSQRSRADLLGAVVAVYVSRVTGEPAFDLGLEVGDRESVEELLDRLFATVVPMRIELDERAPFDDALARVATAAGEARRRGPYARDVFTRHPALRHRGALASALPIVLGSSPSEGVAVQLLVSDGERECVLVYDPGAISDEDARRIIGHLSTLMAAIARTPSTPISELPLLDTAEREQLLVEWNRTESDYPCSATVHELFAAQAARTPDAAAVTFGDETLSFAELDRRANRWAHRLRELGVGPDVLVGLCAERSPELIVGLLAILKAGGAYVPLDPAYPPERTSYVLRDTAMPVVLTQAALRSRVGGGSSAVLALDEPLPGPYPHDAPDSRAGADHLAYVIYTSGSTGAPKGVLVHHRGVVNYLTWCVAAYDIAGGSGAPVHSSIAFDLTVTSVLAPLVAGRPVHLLDERKGIEELAAALRRHEALSLVKITPSHLELLRLQLEPAELAGRTRALVIGGENLTGDTIATWQRHAPETLIVNEYGPTETVVGCCVYTLRGGEPVSGSVPIGRPIANTRLYVLDRHQQPLPVGVPGELYIGGAGVARGYLNRPELTAERFLADPFAHDERARMYRTGDWVRWRADGNLEFLGRVDRQLKIRGHRIEPGEIESALVEHPAVRDAVVTAHGAAAERRLLAYVAADRRAVEPDEIRRWLSKRLPEHMVPAAVMILDVLPLTANGKIDLDALPAPEWRPRPAGRPVLPRTHAERVLVEIWEDMLGIPVGITDDFFELGGHSLLAVRMIQRAGERLGRKPSLSVMLSHPTIEHVAAALIDLDAPDRPPIALIREGEPEVTPFFYFHGDYNGTGYYAHRVAAHLPREQPIYFLAPHELEGADSIEAMAAERVEQIRAIQPSGPYLLGGLCNGAAVAFEVARLLTERGERVELLALINVANRTARLESLRRNIDVIGGALGMSRDRQVDLFLSLRERVLWNLEELPPVERGAPLRVRARFGRALAARMARKVAGRVAARLGRNGFGSGAETPADSHAGGGSEFAEEAPCDRERNRHQARLMESFVPQFYPGRATIIWWEWSAAFEYERSLHVADPTRGWASVTAEVELRRIPGENRTVLTRSAEALGRELTALLRAAHERSRAGARP